MNWTVQENAKPNLSLSANKLFQANNNREPEDIGKDLKVGHIFYLLLQTKIKLFKILILPQKSIYSKLCTKLKITNQ